MPNYIYLIHPLREEFFTNPTREESDIMREHFDYLKAGIQSGKVILAGPCLDDTFGLVVFEAEDDNAANTIMMTDPSVQSNVMMAELHPFKISLLSSK